MAPQIFIGILNKKRMVYKDTHSIIFMLFSLIGVICIIAFQNKHNKKQAQPHYKIEPVSNSL